MLSNIRKQKIIIFTSRRRPQIPKALKEEVMIQGWSGMKVFYGGLKIWVGYFPRSIEDIIFNDEMLETFL